MEHIILSISHYLSYPSTLYLINRDTYNTMSIIRDDILSSLLCRYPTAYTYMDAWRSAILHNDIDTIIDAISIIPFTDTMYSWWVQMLDMIGMTYIVEPFVPKGLSIRSTISIPDNIYIETLPPKYISQYHVDDMIHHVMTISSPMYRDMVSSVIDERPISLSREDPVYQHYIIWISITDAYRLSKTVHSQYKYARGRILQHSTTSCTLSPYYLYEMYKDREEGMLYTLYRLEYRPSLSLLYIHINTINILRYMIYRGSMIYDDILHDIMRDKGIDPLWYVHLLDSGCRTSDIPPDLHIVAIVSMIDAIGVGIDIPMRMLDRLLLLYKETIPYSIVDRSTDRKLCNHIASILR